MNGNDYKRGVKKDKMKYWDEMCERLTRRGDTWNILERAKKSFRKLQYVPSLENSDEAVLLTVIK